MKNSTLLINNSTWLRQFDKAMENNISNPLLTNYQLAKSMGISNGLLTTKLKEITGLTPRKYIREYRLKTAFKYLKEGKYHTVAQVASAVGFVNVGYFNRKFTGRFNIAPFQLLKDNGWR